MAKVKDIFGAGITGKVANLSYYTVLGKTVVRGIPAHKHRQRSVSQLRNQERFGKIQQFCMQFKFVLIPQIWNAQAHTCNGYNLFMKANSPAFGPDGLITDPGLIRLSIGDLSLPPDIQVNRSAQDPALIEVSWKTGFAVGSIPLWDELLVISAGGGSYSLIKSTGLKRGDLGGIFELPALETEATHLYLFFGSLDRRSYSESVCVGL